MVSKYAILSGDIVANVIIAEQEFVDTLDAGTWMLLEQGSRVGPNWVYNGTDFAEPAPLVINEITPADFMRRFTMAEWIAADTLSKTDEVMAYAFAMFNLVTVVHLNHPDTINFVGYMMSKSILTQTRLNTILGQS